MHQIHPSTQPIFLTHKAVGFGRPRLVLVIVTMRGSSTSVTATRTTTVRAATIMFGWLGSDSVLRFCFVVAWDWAGGRGNPLWLP